MNCDYFQSSRNESIQSNFLVAKTDLTLIVMSAPLYLTENQVKSLLSWDKLIPAIERILGDLSTKDEAFSVVQPPRIIMRIQAKNGYVRINTVD